MAYITHDNLPSIEIEKHVSVPEFEGERMLFDTAYTLKHGNFEVETLGTLPEALRRFADFLEHNTGA